MSNMKELNFENIIKDYGQIVKSIYGVNPYENGEQRSWDEHKDECNGCALCEL